jgi:Protein of unknown function (DUF2786)
VWTLTTSLRIWRLGVRIPRGAHNAPGQRPGLPLRKAAATSFPHEAAACRDKAEALRTKYGL